MNLPLNSLGRAVLAIAALASAGGYLRQVTLDVRESAWEESAHAAGLEQATELRPSNAEAEFRLGRFLLKAEQNDAAALPHLERATRLNPRVPWYWLELASAYQLAGREQEREAAVLKAAAVDPKTPLVAEEAADLLLAAGALDRALPYYRAAIEGDPEGSAASSFRTCWRATHDVPRLLRELTPPTVSAHSSFISVLVDESQFDDALQVWDAMVRLGQPIPPRPMMPLVEKLIRARRVADAERVWEGLAANDASLRRGPDESNLLVNGSFDEDFIGAGFDWLIEPPTGVRLLSDSQEIHSSTRSLSIVFDGPAVQLGGLRQLVPVQPDTEYQLSYWGKAKELQTAVGPRIFIQDTYTGEVIDQGDEWLGSTAWREEKLNFKTGPQTNLITVLVRREPFDKLISGRLWLDGMKLTRK